MPDISFITTCKGRLDHLRQTLPRMTVQRSAECIVVDYDCPDGTAPWVQANFPAVQGVKVIKVNQAPLFNKSHANNLGAAVATAPWLCFIDADILVSEGFAASLGQTLAHSLESRLYLRPAPVAFGAYGSFVCTRRDFEATGGFDETFEGCSYMDDDLYVRLQMAGLQEANFPGEHFVAIAHDHELRTRHYEIKHRPVSHRINSFYANIKHDLMRQSGGGNLALADRRAIYGEVKKVVLAQFESNSDCARLELTLPVSSSVPIRYASEIRRKWIFELVNVALAPMPPRPL